MIIRVMLWFILYRASERPLLETGGAGAKGRKGPRRPDATTIMESRVVPKHRKTDVWKRRAAYFYNGISSGELRAPGNVGCRNCEWASFQNKYG